MLNKDLEMTLNKAFLQAKEARHEFMTVEHLLLALLENPAAQQAYTRVEQICPKAKT